MIEACSSGTPGGRSGIGGSSSIGRTKHRCFRSSFTRSSAGAWSALNAVRRLRRARSFATERKAEADAVLARITAQGPMTAAEFESRGERKRLVGVEPYQAGA